MCLEFTTPFEHLTITISNNYFKYALKICTRGYFIALFVFKESSQSSMTSVSGGRKGTGKVTKLLEIERNVQQTWETERPFEVNAPTPGSSEAE